MSFMYSMVDARSILIDMILYPVFRIHLHHRSNQQEIKIKFWVYVDFRRENVLYIRAKKPKKYLISNIVYACVCR